MINKYKEVEIVTLVSYLYLGYSNLIINWLRYKGAKSKEDVKVLMRPIIVGVVKDINNDPRTFGKLKARELEANQSIKDILLNFK